MKDFCAGMSEVLRELTVEEKMYVDSQGIIRERQMT
jgi:hypothetical protein